MVWIRSSLFLRSNRKQNTLKYAYFHKIPFVRSGQLYGFDFATTVVTFIYFV